MKKFWAVAVALLLALVTGGAEARIDQPTVVGLNDVIDTLEKSYRVLNDVTADFFQRSTLVAKKREMRADGQMFLKPPTSYSPLMFRFDYFRPLTQEIVCNGKTMWMYLPENNQVIQSDVSFSSAHLAPTNTRISRSTSFRGWGGFPRIF